MTRATAFAAPVDDGMMFWDAPLPSAQLKFRVRQGDACDEAPKAIDTNIQCHLGRSLQTGIMSLALILMVFPLTLPRVGGANDKRIVNSLRRCWP
jgi:hypothetical protein